MLWIKLCRFVFVMASLRLLMGCVTDDEFVPSATICQEEIESFSKVRILLDAKTRNKYQAATNAIKEKCVMGEMDAFVSSTTTAKKKPAWMKKLHGLSAKQRETLHEFIHYEYLKALTSEKESSQRTCKMLMIQKVLRAKERPLPLADLCVGYEQEMEYEFYLGAQMVQKLSEGLEKRSLEDFPKWPDQAKQILSTKHGQEICKSNMCALQSKVALQDVTRTLEQVEFRKEWLKTKAGIVCIPDESAKDATGSGMCRPNKAGLCDSGFLLKRSEIDPKGKKCVPVQEKIES